MPPWRTAALIRPALRPLSRATIASASSADWRCWASKSAGTYWASITGVVGNTFKSRTEPPDAFASDTAVSIADLARSVSARSTGTRIFLNIVLPLICRRRDRARGDVTVKPARAVVDSTPLFHREIDHRECGGREFLPQPFAQFDIARGNQQLGHLLQSRIVADHEQRALRIILGPDNRQDDLRRRRLEALVKGGFHLGGPLRRNLRPGLMGAA